MVLGSYLIFFNMNSLEPQQCWRFEVFVKAPPACSPPEGKFSIK